MIKIGTKTFDTKRHTYVMGILNVTPDSFYDGGKHSGIDGALSHVQKMIDEGADIIDVGGESTRPGYQKISDGEEIDRVCQVITRIKQSFDIPVSCDTYKSAVASAALSAGADLINDIWGLKGDEHMAAVIAKSGAPCVLMHNRDQAEYKDFLKELKQDLSGIAAAALKAGIANDKIILDPGVGFGKTIEHNLAAIASLSALNKLGYPVLLGASNKSVVGAVLNLPVDKRLYGTLALTVMAVMQSTGFVRVHNISENKQAIAMAESVKKYM